MTSTPPRKTKRNTCSSICTCVLGRLSVGVSCAEKAIVLLSQEALACAFSRRKKQITFDLRFTFLNVNVPQYKSYAAKDE